GGDRLAGRYRDGSGQGGGEAVEPDGGEVVGHVGRGRIGELDREGSQRAAVDGLRAGGQADDVPRGDRQGGQRDGGRQLLAGRNRIRGGYGRPGAERSDLAGAHVRDGPGELERAGARVAAGEDRGVPDELGRR